MEAVLSAVSSSAASANPVVSPAVSTVPSGSLEAASPAASPAAASTGTEKKKRVIIGLPGDHFSQAFLLSWTESLVALINTGRYDVIVSPGKSSFVPFARMKTLGVDVMRGKAQKPFNGAEYDVFVSLDSDVVFSPTQLMELIECTAAHPVVSGYYMMADNQHFAVVKEWSKEYFLKHGTFSFMVPSEVEEDVKAFAAELQERKRCYEAKQEMPPLSSPRFVEVAYVGMGFFACRREVLDALAYPYFHRDLQRMRSKEGVELVDMCSEDVALCKNIQDAGFDIMLNTRLRVGHEKSVVL